MNLITTILLLPVLASASIVDAAFVKAVGKIESNNNPDAVGDSGAARGEFQIHKEAWDQVNAARKSRGEETFIWRFNAHDSKVAVLYATEYLKWIESSLTKKLKRQPTKAEIYAGWNLGLGSFAKRGYDISKVPTITKNAISKL